MAPKFDFHIHTSISACANDDMMLKAIVSGCEKVGLEKIGMTDHLNSAEQIEKNAALIAEIEASRTDIEIYFGAEVGFSHNMRDHPLSQEQKEEHGFQYAIGTHHSTYLKEYDLAKLIDAQHRHHLATCANPAMDVLGHPYRFLRPEFHQKNWPWFDSVSVVPEKLTRELGQTAKETGTAIEINSTSNLVNKFNPNSYFEGYVHYVSILADEGVTFALGSDAHELHEFRTIKLVWEVVDRLGITDDRIWRPDCEPASARNR